MIKKDKVLICVPTFNEILTIKFAIEDIRKVCSTCHLLIIDDNSPDGTATLVKELIKSDDKIHILENSHKLGLGRAYISAFDWGLHRGFDYFVQFDADGSHSASYICEMFSLIENNDIVVGSRQIAGGGSTNWSLRRRVLSNLGNAYSQALLGTRNRVADLTGGFNFITRNLLEKVNYRSFSSKGYLFQIEMKYRVLQLGLSIVEMPITFLPRRAGESKMSVAITVEALLGVLALRLKK